jgi:hypothetical protein
MCFSFSLSNVGNGVDRFARQQERNKKADVAEHPKVFHHVGLLSNEPSAAADCSFYSRPKTSRQNLQTARGSPTRAAIDAFF